MEIRTGYFSQQKKYEELGCLPISISRISPKWYHGYTAIEISPSAELLYEYKHNSVNIEQYTTEYLCELDKRVVNVYLSQWEKLVEKHNVKGVVLLCYEKPTDFCHRHLLANFLNQEYDMNVTELMVNKEHGIN